MKERQKMVQECYNMSIEANKNISSPFYLMPVAYNHLISVQKTSHEDAYKKTTSGCKVL